MHSSSRRPVSPDAVAIAMCALGGAIGSIPIAGGFPMANELLKGHPQSLLTIAILTAALTIVVVGLALRTTVALLVPFGAVGGGVVASLSLASLLARMTFTGEGSVAPSILGLLNLLVLGGLYAGFFGAFVGLLFAFVYLAPVAIAAHHRKKGRYDADGRTGITCAVWLALVSAASIPCAPDVDTWGLGVASGIAGLVISVIVFAWSIVRVSDVRRGERLPEVTLASRAIQRAT